MSDKGDILLQYLYSYWAHFGDYTFTLESFWMQDQYWNTFLGNWTPLLPLAEKEDTNTHKICGNTTGSPRTCNNMKFSLTCKSNLYLTHIEIYLNSDI